MNQEIDYEFLDYDYYDYYNDSPLNIIMINEQYKILRETFYNLEDDCKNILYYFIILRKNIFGSDIDLDKYIEKLRINYLKNYNNCI